MSQFIEMFGDTHMRSDHSRQWKEVVEIINGKDYKSIQVEDGGYPVYGTGGEMARASDYLSPANSILLGRKGTIDKPLLIREKYWNVDTAFGAVPDEKVLHYVYFYWHCKTIDFNVLNKGTTLPSTTKVDLLNLWIKIPSMEEQTRFGSIVEQADKSEFVGCKSQFIEIFYGMETTPVKDYIDDSFPGEWGTEDKDGNGVKVIRTTNFTNSGKLNLADVVTRSIEDRKVVRKQIKKYDTILERSGGTADNPVGRVVLFEEDNLFLCNNFTQVLRFKDVDPRFAFYALYYFYQTNRTAIRSMGSKTTGIQNLNMSKYLEIGIPNASDEDQKAFVTIAEQADKSEFVGCKSQFIEMFGDTHMRSDHSRQWKEVVEIINGKDYKSIQVEDGGYPVYGTGGEMARASDYLSPANSILLGRKGTIDKPLLIREKYWNVDTAFGAVPDEKVLHYVYFYWHCKTIDFNVLNKGTTLPSTTKVDLLNLWIKIPSMEEQTRFGSIVEQADKSEFVGCKSQFIEIFYGMETTPVKDYIDDSFPGEWGTEDKDGNGVKVIRTTNFTNSGKLNLADVVTRSIEDRKVVRKQIKKYDTILERSGGTADNPVGRVVLFEEDNLFLCNNFTQVLRFKDVDPRFAFYALYYFYQTNRTAIRSMGSKTTGIQNLNMSKYLEIGIPNASDEDQKAFVTIAEQADKSEFELRKSIEAIDQVIKSLINN